MNTLSRTIPLYLCDLLVTGKQIMLNTKIEAEKWLYLYFQKIHLTKFINQ